MNALPQVLSAEERARVHEESLELTPKDFSLSARRPGADLMMNDGSCTLRLDGSGTMG
jgi:hypothetical protein